MEKGRGRGRRPWGGSEEGDAGSSGLSHGSELLGADHGGSWRMGATGLLLAVEPGTRREEGTEHCGEERAPFPARELKGKQRGGRALGKGDELSAGRWSCCPARVLERARGRGGDAMDGSLLPEKMGAAAAAQGRKQGEERMAAEIF
jgi:hypothetical protein